MTTHEILRLAAGRWCNADPATNNSAQAPVRWRLSEDPILVEAVHRPVFLSQIDPVVEERGKRQQEAYRFGDELVDPDTEEVLGYQGLYVGEGRISRTGDPSTLALMATTREARRGDYLLEIEDAQPANYFPRAPSGDIEGRIISVINGLSLVGQYQAVVLNRGAVHGLEDGHVLRAFTAGRIVEDEVGESAFRGELVQFPEEPAGTMLVFRVFDRMSYALVMEATREIRVLDSVKNPES